MSRRKSLDPNDWMGVYKHLDDVPDRYRLAQHADAYAGRDVWGEFCKEYEYARGSHARYKQEVDRHRRSWCTFMADRGRHHALATPADVEAWSAQLLEDKSLRTAEGYWSRIRRFYDWLQWHTEHPHVYHPVLMAAANGDAAARIWSEKVKTNLKARENYDQQR